MTNFYTQLNKKLMEQPKPSQFLQEAMAASLFEAPPLDIFLKMAATEQSKQHHPEGNVWAHTLMVVDKAAGMRHESKSPQVFMWACLLHDIGKPATTKLAKGKITSYGHDLKGAKIVREFLRPWGQPASFVNAVAGMVRWHMQPLFILKNRKSDIRQMCKEVDVEELALLSFCDRTGRLNADIAKEKENRRQFLLQTASYIKTL